MVKPGWHFCLTHVVLNVLVCMHVSQVGVSVVRFFLIGLGEQDTEQFLTTAFFIPAFFNILLAMVHVSSGVNWQYVGTLHWVILFFWNPMMSFTFTFCVVVKHVLNPVGQVWLKHFSGAFPAFEQKRQENACTKMKVRNYYCLSEPAIYLYYRYTIQSIKSLFILCCNLKSM